MHEWHMSPFEIENDFSDEQFNLLMFAMVERFVLQNAPPEKESVAPIHANMLPFPNQIKKVVVHGNKSG